MKHSRLLLCALFGALAACGGGGDGPAPAPVDSGSAGVVPAPVPAPAPAPAPGPVPSPAPGPSPAPAPAPAPAPSEPASITFSGGAVQQANTTAAEDQRAPLIAPVPQGGFVVTWNSGQGPQTGVHGQRFAADGSKVGGEFAVFLARFTSLTGWSGYQGGGLATLADGSFIASASSGWFEDQGGGPRSAVHVQRFDLAGNPVGPQVLVDGSGNYDTFVQAGPVFARSDGGFAVIVYHVARPTPRIFVDAFLYTFDAAGQRVAAPVRISADGPSPAGIAQLQNGNILVASTRFNPRGRNLVWAMVTGTGQPVAAVERPFLPDTESFAAGVTALENGNAVITWTQEVPGAPDKVLGQLVDPSGNTVGPEFELPAAGQVTGLPGGGFVLTWHASGELFAQHFNSSGAAAGDAVRIDPALHAEVSGSSWQAQPYEVLPTGGGFVLASQELNAATGVDIHVQPFTAQPQ